jgi:hypothetical protein
MARIENHKYSIEEAFRECLYALSDEDVVERCPPPRSNASPRARPGHRRDRARKNPNRERLGF